MREVAIIAYHQTPMVRDAGAKNDVELVMEAVHGCESSGRKFKNTDIDFTCSGSCDYLGGAAFAFVGALDATGAQCHLFLNHTWKWMLHGRCTKRGSKSKQAISTPR
jgi:hypothetical protein